MGRPGLLRHRKFIRLARLLDSDALAAGHLEIIWHATYEAGDPNVGSAEDLEYLARWKGEPGRLAALLAECGFIDVDRDGSHHVHDLIDNAPDYVRKRMDREDARRAKGLTISELRAAAGRASGAARRAQSTHDSEQTANTCSTNGEQTGTNVRPPAPAPAPAPAPNTPLTPQGGNGKPQRTRFVPPTLDQVAAYCTERANGIDAATFVDHYEANGWRQGKGGGRPVRDWQACVRTWEHQRKAESRPTGDRATDRRTTCKRCGRPFAEVGGAIFFGDTCQTCYDEGD